MKKKIINLLVGFTLFSTITTSVIISSSCSVKNPNNVPEEGIIDYDLQSHFNNWYNSLTTHPWNYKNNKLENYYCESEQQGIFMYANQRGYYWNEYLHKNEIPPNQDVPLPFGGLKNPLPVRGEDFKYVVDALNKESTKWPYNYTVYHGVEYQEVEFWDQLKEFIKEDSNGNFDYSGVVGKSITSYGFISTTLDKIEALRYCDGSNWINDEKFLPLKEQVMFKIKIPKDIIGAVYLGDFKFMGSKNNDNQVLLNRYCTFKINNIYVERNDRNEKVNVFDVDLVYIGEK